MASSQPLSADHLIDRSRLRRKLSFWRIAAVLALVIAIGALGYRLTGGSAQISGDHIARISITGVITGDESTKRLLERVGNSNAKAVILSISSPGGTVTGSEALYDDIRDLAGKKPVVAVVEGMAASGAYIAALGADHIVAKQNSIVGSIGVLVQFPNFAKLLETVGVNVETIKSSPLKAAPNGLEPTSPAAREAISAIVMDSYDWFKTLVAERRKLDARELEAVANGRVFTGRQSLALKLVDEIGNERVAVAWLEKEKNIAKNLRIRTWRPSAASAFSLSSVAALFGFDAMARKLEVFDAGRNAAALDGLLAVWHGGLGD